MPFADGALNLFTYFCTPPLCNVTAVASTGITEMSQRGKTSGNPSSVTTENISASSSQHLWPKIRSLLHPSSPGSHSEQKCTSAGKMELYHLFKCRTLKSGLEEQRTITLLFCSSENIQLHRRT